MTQRIEEKKDTDPKDITSHVTVYSHTAIHIAIWSRAEKRQRENHVFLCIRKSTVRPKKGHAGRQEATFPKKDAMGYVHRGGAFSDTNSGFLEGSDALRMENRRR